MLHKKWCRRFFAAVLAGTLLITTVFAQPDIEETEESTDSSVIESSSDSIGTDVPPETSQVESILSEPSAPGDSSELLPSVTGSSSDMNSDSSDHKVGSSEPFAYSSQWPVSSFVPVSSHQANDPPSYPLPTISPEWNEELDTVYNNACDWLGKENGGDWYFIALGGAGRSIDSRQYGTFLSAASNTTYDSLYRISLIALNATFCGLNATNVQDIDYIDVITGYELFDPTDTKSAAFALLALDSNPYAVSENSKLNREDFYTALAQNQNKDGSFQADETYDALSMTAIALTALSNYADRSVVREAVNKGVGYLQQQYAKSAFRKENCSVLSRIIAALNSLNININDSRFSSAKRNLCEQLKTFMESDGGFREKQTDTVSSLSATQSAIIALTSIRYFRSPYLLRQSLPDAVSSKGELPETEQGPYFLLWILLAVVLALTVAVLVLWLWKREKENRTEEHTKETEE